MQVLATSLLLIAAFYLVRVQLVTFSALNHLSGETASHWQEERNVRLCGQLAATAANLRASSLVLTRILGGSHHHLPSLAQKMRDQIFEGYPLTSTPRQDGSCDHASDIGLTTTLHLESSSAASSSKPSVMANWVSLLTRVDAPPEE